MDNVNFPVKRIPGGKLTCSRCNEPRCTGSAYCQEHRNEYQREWKRNVTKKLRELVQFKRDHILRSSGG